MTIPSEKYINLDDFRTSHAAGKSSSMLPIILIIDT